MSRREEGRHTRFHKQLLRIAERFSASGTDIASFDFELLNQLKGLRESVDYSILGEASTPGYDIAVSGEQAQSVLTEASTLAEQRMRERFPELPTPAVRRPPEQAIS